MKIINSAVLSSSGTQSVNLQFSTVEHSSKALMIERFRNSQSGSYSNKMKDTLLWKPFGWIKTSVKYRDRVFVYNRYWQLWSNMTNMLCWRKLGVLQSPWHNPGYFSACLFVTVTMKCRKYNQWNIRKPHISRFLQFFCENYETRKILAEIVFLARFQLQILIL